MIKLTIIISAEDVPNLLHSLGGLTNDLKKELTNYIDETDVNISGIGFDERGSDHDWEVETNQCLQV